MLEIISFLCLFSGFGLLYALSIIDLRIGLLPNKLVLAFMTFGIAFNIATLFEYTDIKQMILGALFGGGILYAIRTAAYMYYRDDALGLGDVKLLGAAGIWLGPQSILLALIVGASSGLIHGVGIAAYTRIKTGKRVNMGTLSIPAGPGFAVGIVLIAAYKFYPLFLKVIS